MRGRSPEAKGGGGVEGGGGQKGTVFLASPKKGTFLNLENMDPPYRGDIWVSNRCSAPHGQFQLSLHCEI